VVRKAAFRVLWTETAVRDLESLLGYIAAASPINAGKVLARLKSKAESLKTTPGRGRLVPELVQHGLPVWRELIVRPYRILYRIDRRTVSVLGVLDPRRDLEDVLLERLIRT
jgi:toxin ParE1/3/4